MTKNLILIISLVIFFLSCADKSAVSAYNASVLNKQLVTSAKPSIRSGDIILRSGKDFTSYRIRELSENNKKYSHAGIAYVQDTNVYIYHITPPDIDEPASDSAMRLEPIEKFASPLKCFGFGIERYQLNTEEINAVIAHLDTLYKKKIPFDYRFDLADTDRMYCSEMVDNTLRCATANRITLPRRYFTKLQALKASRYFHASVSEVNKRQYIPIDYLQLNPYCTLIHDYVFYK